MIPLPSRSPFTGGEIIVTRFYCPESDSSVEGSFTVNNPFSQLSPEQLEFIELFVRCEGRISRMEGALDLSYPTIRSRLKEVVEALGYVSEEASDHPDTISSANETAPEQNQNGAEEIANSAATAERQRIIQALDTGDISFEEAMKRLSEDK